MIEQRSADDIALDTARAFASTVADRWQSRLGDTLLAVRLIGSLAHGGFSRRYSDIDMAVIGETGLTPEQFDSLHAEAAVASDELAAKLSIFWSDRSFASGRFPPLDRVDYLDHGVALVERECVLPPRPHLTDIRSYLCGRPFSAWQQAAAQFAAAPALEPKAHKGYVRAHLYPARFVYSFMTGRMGSNDDAVAYVVQRPPAGLDIGLIERALQCRQAAADPDALFAARAELPRQVAACAALVDESCAEAP